MKLLEECLKDDILKKEKYLIKAIITIFETTGHKIEPSFHSGMFEY